MIIDGKKIAEEIHGEIKNAIAHVVGRPPCLAVILVGEHPASKIYVNRKTRSCEEVGILSIKKILAKTASEEELILEIQQFNANPEVDGILVQLPLPKQIRPSLVASIINPQKDVDGFHPINVGKMLLGETDGFLSCTPLGIRELLLRSNIDVAGKHAVLIGRSNIVGKPMAALFMQKSPGGNATVTVTHQHTKNLKEISRMGDIVIAAIGKARFVTADMVKDGAIVIDVGINKIEDPTTKNGFRLVGDVDFDRVKDKCSFITPVPGGVGPMTIATLLQNTLKSYRQREGLVLS